MQPFHNPQVEQLLAHLAKWPEIPLDDPFALEIVMGLSLISHNFLNRKLASALNALESSINQSVTRK
jgi:hypothetical protein